MVEFMGQLYLVRHGQASFGSDNYDRLSELGLRQSEILANHLRSTDLIPNSICAGPLERHKATAQALQNVYGYAGIDLPDLETVEEFREYNAKAIIMAAVKADRSLAELLPRIYEDAEAFRKVFGSAMRMWVTEALDFEGTESFEDLKRRVHVGMERIRVSRGRGARIVVFTSGGVIAASLANTLGISGLDAMRLNWQVVNTSVTSYVFDENKFTLSGFNSIEHLRIQRDPSLITLY